VPPRAEVKVNMAFIKVCFLLLALAAGNDVDTCATSPEGCPASSDTEPTTLLQSRISVTGSSDALDAALADTDASPNAALANNSKKHAKNIRAHLATRRRINILPEAFVTMKLLVASIAAI